MRIDNHYFTIRELQMDDLDYIAANLRAADARELRDAAGHSNYRDRLTMFVAESFEVRIVEYEGTPILVFGLGFVDESTGVAWTVGTTTVSRSLNPWVKQVRIIIRRWFNEHPKLQKLVNLTHGGNRLYIRWIKAAGAIELAKVPQGPQGTLYRTFLFERPRLEPLQEPNLTASSVERIEEANHAEL